MNAYRTVPSAPWWRDEHNASVSGTVQCSLIQQLCSSLDCVTLGIGVPIMLAYVYGVVPISLCRGGGCGVSREKGRGVRIDFDEDDGPITGSRSKMAERGVRRMRQRAEGVVSDVFHHEWLILRFAATVLSPTDPIGSY